MKKKNIETEETVQKVEENTTLKNDNKKTLIITICMAIAVLIGLYVAYTKLLNPKSIFIKSINKGYAKFEEKLDKYIIETDESKPMVMTSSVKFNMDADENLLDAESKKMIEEINKLELSEKVGLDQKNSKSFANVKLSYDKDDLFDLGFYLQNKKFYLELKNVFDKYIEIPMDEYDFENGSLNVSKDELKYIMSKTKDYVINNMNSKDFKQESEKIKKDKKTIKVSKITYGLSEKSTTELALNFLKDINKDSKYIKILATLSDTKESEIKESIKEGIKSIEEAKKEGKLDKTVKVRFGVLTSGFIKKHVGYIIETEDGAKFVYYKKGNKKELRLAKDNKDLISSSTEGNKTVVTLNSNGQELVININKTQKDNKTTYSYNMDASGASLSGKLVIDKIKENKDGTGESKITADVSMMGLITFKVTVNTKAEYVKKLEMPDTSNSVKYEDLSEEDMKKIEEKLMNNEAIKSFVEAFGSYTGGSDSLVY